MSSGMYDSLENDFASRRARLQHFRAGGTGRQITKRTFASNIGLIQSKFEVNNIVSGKRTGIKLIRTNNRDSRGFEDLDDIFGLNDEASNYLDESQTDEPFDVNTAVKSNNNQSISLESPIPALQSASKSSLSAKSISPPFSSQTNKTNFTNRQSSINDINQSSAVDDDEPLLDTQPKKLQYDDNDNNNNNDMADDYNEPVSGADDDNAQPIPQSNRKKSTPASKKPLKSALTTPSTQPKPNRKSLTINESINVEFNDNNNNDNLNTDQAYDNEANESKYNSARKSTGSSNKRKPDEKELEHNNNIDMNDYNNYDMNDNNNDDYNEELEIKPKAVKVKKSKSDREKARRRQTQKLIDEANETGALDEMTNNVLLSSAGRPKRLRMAPLQFWRGEYVQHKRTEDGLGAVVPVIDKIVKPADTPQVTKKTKSNRNNNNNNKKSKSQDELSDNESHSKSNNYSLSKEILVLNKDTNTPERRIVMKSSTELLSSLVRVKQHQLPNTPPTPKHLLPQGGKAFEEAEFSAGLLILAPQTSKEREIAGCIESFYVVSAEENSLSVTIHNTAARLSKGDSFFVPAGNTYFIKNISHTKEAKLHFTLVKPHAQIIGVFQQPLQVNPNEQGDNDNTNNNNNTNTISNDNNVPVKSESTTPYKKQQPKPLNSANKNANQAIDLTDEHANTNGNMNNVNEDDKSISSVEDDINNDNIDTNATKIK